ncbi:MAG: YihA family ribosome biogenesis GTP-binding protein [Deltaproteobacteria bacterium]|nr:YihA family ribosome biogenesis GTP-binding protein [Deltaproteobacteria bacterium]MBW2361377.1 YihA family ribosome biogenesis GTP-binding protein [Deltaproteobacteria bacterium]
MKLRNVEYMLAAAKPDGFPAPQAPEVAFLGRSNVGKSSLLNKLVNRKALARTSSTPGKTRLLHWFRVTRPQDELWFVDLPGYGYAKVAKSERRHWQDLIEAYLGDRDTLRLAVLLQDLRRDVSEDETLLLEWLAERQVPSVVALTKCDKLKPMRRAAQVKKLKAQLGLSADRVVATSAEKGFGIPELWSAIDRHL